MELDRSILQALRSGDRDAQGRVLARYTPWLRMLARFQMETRLRRKFDATDVVQQAMVEALGAFPRFRGTTEAELTAWLRSILAHVLAHEVRRYAGAQKRDVAREVSMEAALAETSLRLGEVLAASGSSPSVHAARRESEVLLVEALERLSEDHREVIFLRNVEGLPHEEVAERMGRSPGAVRMLWVRALAELRRELGELD